MTVTENNRVHLLLRIATAQQSVLGAPIFAGVLLGASFLLVFPACAKASENPQDILIIANKSVKSTGIGLEEIKGFFLKKRKFWPNQLKAVPINQKADSPLRVEFARRVLDMSPMQEKNYWGEMKIRRGEMGIPEFAHVLKATFKLKGSIGYIYRHEYREGVVNVLLVLPHESDDSHSKSKRRK